MIWPFNIMMMKGKIVTEKEEIPPEPFRPSNPVELKIKALSLGLEAMVIKQEEYRSGVLAFSSKQRRELIEIGLTIPIPTPQTELPEGITPKHGKRTFKTALKTFLATLTPEQADRLQRRRKAAKARIHTIREHRIETIRNEARATHLARAFLRGIPYSTVEQKAWECPLQGRLSAIGIKALNLALRYRNPNTDTRIIQQRFEEWTQTGRTYWEAYWKPIRREEKIKQELKFAAASRAAGAANLSLTPMG